MADLYYAVWDTAAEVANGPVKAEGKVAIGGTSTQSAAVVDPAGGNRSRRVRLFADGPCFVTWGENPTAVSDGTDGRPVGAENPEYVEILANHLIAVIERV
jgi:hypothetical protein